MAVYVKSRQCRPPQTSRQRSASRRHLAPVTLGAPPAAAGQGRPGRGGIGRLPLLQSPTPATVGGRSRTERGALSVLDRSLVTLIALGRLIDTTGVKRTLEITNKRANYHVDLERASLKIYPLHI